MNNLRIDLKRDDTGCGYDIVDRVVGKVVESRMGFRDDHTAFEHAAERIAARAPNVTFFDSTPYTEALDAYAASMETRLPVHRSRIRYALAQALATTGYVLVKREDQP